MNPIFFESSNQSEKLRRLEERKYLCDIPLWSVDKTHPDYSGQSDVFNLIGKPLINDALEGLNCSLFAYGKRYFSIPHFIESLSLPLPRQVKRDLERHTR